MKSGYETSETTVHILFQDIYAYVITARPTLNPWITYPASVLSKSFDRLRGRESCESLRCKEKNNIAIPGEHPETK